MALLRMTAFHVTRFKDTPFFVHMLFISTLQVVALQALSAHADPSAASNDAWLRAGLVGMWSVTTVSAGILGFQRFQGTLVHIARTPRPQWTTLLPVVGAASLFGFLALPLAAAASFVLGPRPALVSWPGLLGGIVAFWAGSMVMSCVIGSVFILSRHATTYEAVVGLPIVLLSGVFGYPDFAYDAVARLASFMPLSWPVNLVFSSSRSGVAVDWPSAAGWVLTVLVWSAAAALLGKAATSRAIAKGTLELT